MWFTVKLFALGQSMIIHILTIRKQYMRLNKSKLNSTSSLLRFLSPIVWRKSLRNIRRYSMISTLAVLKSFWETKNYVYPQTSDLRQISRQWNCWSIRCNWSIACPRCSSSIFRCDTWLQWVRQRQLQDETINIPVWGIGVTNIRGLTVHYLSIFIAKIVHRVEIVYLGRQWTVYSEWNTMAVDGFVTQRTRSWFDLILPVYSVHSVTRFKQTVNTILTNSE